MLGGVVKDEASAVATVESRPAPRGAVEVDVEVVPDDVDRSLRILSGDLAHEPQQVLALPRRAADRDDLPGAHIKGRNDGPRAVPFVLPFATRAAAGPAGSPMIGKTVFQGLHAGHLVNAEHGAAGGRVDIEVADLGHLLPKLRIGAVQPAAHQMRPDVALREDPLHGRLADRRHNRAGDRLLPHVLDGPRDRDVLGLPAAVLPGVLLTDRLTGQRDDLAAGHRAEFQRMAPAGEIPKALEALQQESPAPALDAPDGNPQAIRDLTRAAAFGARQDDPRPRRVTLCAGGGVHPRGQFCRFFGRQLERQRRSSTSRRGTHLGELPYRSLCEMYSAFSVVMSGSDH